MKRDKVKTNREVLLEQLQTAVTTEEFIALQRNGKCDRCSNYFWDGPQAKCHKNINESNCELGYKEWLESYPGENLQEKYHKKYWYFKNNCIAQNVKDLMDLLYASKTITVPTDTEAVCKMCGNQKSCTSTWCYMYYQHLLNLYNAYIREQAKKEDADKDGNDIKHKVYKPQQSITMKTFISTVLLPNIQDTVVKEKITRLLNTKTT